MPRVRNNRSLARAVHGSEDVRRDGRKRGDVDDQPLRLDEQVREGLAHGHNGEDVGLEGLPDIVWVNIRGRMGMRASPEDGLSER